MSEEYTFKQIRDSRTIDAWWTNLILSPLIDKMIWILINYTGLTANQITIASFTFGLLSAYFFLHGTWYYLIIGALLFEFSYLLDCCDGTIARLKGPNDGFGAYLDITSDIIKYFFIIVGIVYGQYLLAGDVSVLLYGYMFIFLEYFCVTNGIIISAKIPNIDNKKEMKSTLYSRITFMKRFKMYFDPYNRLSNMPLSSVEAETLAFFIAPIIMQIKIGLLFGSLILFLNILISVRANLVKK